MTKSCESTKNTKSECSTEPEMFRTEKTWGGRKSTVTECLNHAVLSEGRGQRTSVIRS